MPATICRLPRLVNGFGDLNHSLGSGSQGSWKICRARLQERRRAMQEVFDEVEVEWSLVYNRMIRAELWLRRSPFSAFRVSTTSGARSITRL